MKTSTTQLLLIIAFYTFLITSSYAQKIQWEKSIGGKHADILMDAKPTPDYGFILAGSSLSTKSGNKTDGNNGDLDYYIWKMKENGDPDWQKSFGGSGSDFLQSITLTSDAGFIIAGTSSSNKGFDKTENSKGEEDYWIIKLDASGNQEWQKTIGGSGQDKLQVIQQTTDGGYIIGGSSSSEASIKTNAQQTGEKTSIHYGNLDYWVVKIDSKGTIEWQQTYGGTFVDELRSLEQTIDGGYILGGYSNSPTSGNKTDDNKGIGDYWVVKIDKKGAVEWQKTIGGSQDDQLYVVHQTYDRGYILGGNSNSSSSNDKSRNNTSGTDFWVVKLDVTGKILWQETYDYGKVDILTSLIENEDHTLLLGGFAQGEIADKGKFVSVGKQKTQKGTDDYIALKISESGEVLWDKIVGSDGADILKKVIETRDGGYLMAGTSNPFSTSGSAFSSNSTGSSSLKNLQGNNAQTDRAKNQVNDAIKEQTTDATNSINDTTKELINDVKKAVGISNDSPLKIASPMTNLEGSVLNGDGGSGASGGNGNNGNSNNEKKLPASRDKRDNYGSADFWVVKLKDESKPEKVKLKLEASPNPTYGFTNVIIGYDFDTGTATVVDLAGRQLQQFDITSATVPIDLTSVPEGIYIVNIKTYYQGRASSEGVKIIKGISKN